MYSNLGCPPIDNTLTSDTNLARLTNQTWLSRIDYSNWFSKVMGKLLWQWPTQNKDFVLVSSHLELSKGFVDACAGASKVNTSSQQAMACQFAVLQAELQAIVN